MREVARSRNLLSGFVTTLKRLLESVVRTLFCLLLYICIVREELGHIYLTLGEMYCGQSYVYMHQPLFF